MATSMPTRWDMKPTLVDMEWIVTNSKWRPDFIFDYDTLRYEKESDGDTMVWKIDILYADYPTICTAYVAFYPGFGFDLYD